PPPHWRYFKRLISITFCGLFFGWLFFFFILMFFFRVFLFFFFGFCGFFGCFKKKFLGGLWFSPHRKTRRVALRLPGLRGTCHLFKN
ncbi:hypothetical protein ACVGXO_11655, partial [Enterobacter hormaechei]